MKNLILKEVNRPFHNNFYTDRNKSRIFLDLPAGWDDKKHLAEIKKQIANDFFGKKFGITSSDLSFSRNTGCSSCPCSPGLIVKKDIGTCEGFTAVFAERNEA